MKTSSKLLKKLPKKSKCRQGIILTEILPQTFLQVKKTLIIKTKCTCCFNKLLYFTLFGVCLRACRAKLWETFLRSSFITSRIWSPGRRRPSLKAAPKKQNDQILNLVTLFLYFFKKYKFFS